MKLVKHLDRVVSSILIALALGVASPAAAETVTVDCNTGASVGPVLAHLKSGVNGGRIPGQRGGAKAGQ